MPAHNRLFDLAHHPLYSHHSYPPIMARYEDQRAAVWDDEQKLKQWRFGEFPDYADEFHRRANLLRNDVEFARRIESLRSTAEAEAKAKGYLVPIALDQFLRKRYFDVYMFSESYGRPLLAEIEAQKPKPPPDVVQPTAVETVGHIQAGRILSEENRAEVIFAVPYDSRSDYSLSVASCGGGTIIEAVTGMTERGFTVVFGGTSLVKHAQWIAVPVTQEPTRVKEKPKRALHEVR